MFKKELHRRTMLKGIGTSLALPFLEAMLPPLRAAVKPAGPAPMMIACCCDKLYLAKKSE